MAAEMEFEDVADLVSSILTDPEVLRRDLEQTGLRLADGDPVSENLWQTEGGGYVLVLFASPRGGYRVDVFKDKQYRSHWMSKEGCSCEGWLHRQQCKHRVRVQETWPWLDWK